MSDKTNYQAMRFDPHPTQRMVDACCARIAELEAKLSAPGPVSDSQCDRCQLDASVRADKAEAAAATANQLLIAANAALAERDRMLRLAIEHLRNGDCGYYPRWDADKVLADLRARAEEPTRFHRDANGELVKDARAEEGKP